MDLCKSYIKSEFPSIDIEMFQYIEGKSSSVFRFGYVAAAKDHRHTRFMYSLRFVVVVNIHCLWFPGVLENGIDDFHDSEDVYEAIGEVLQEIANKTESDIR